VTVGVFYIETGGRKTHSLQQPAEKVQLLTHIIEVLHDLARRDAKNYCLRVIDDISKIAEQFVEQPGTNAYNG
jgi:hypothetical protein